MATIARKSSAPAAAKGKFDAEVDIIAIGSGVAGLATALFSRWQGNERAGCWRRPAGSVAPPARRPSGTGCRTTSSDASGRHRGPEERLHRATWRACRGRRFTMPRRPNSACRLGIFAIRGDLRQRLDRDRAACRKKGALEYRHCDFVPDYWAEIPGGQGARRAVCCYRRTRCRSMSDGGEVAIRTMGGDGARDGVDIRTGHRVQRTIVNDGRRGHRRRGRHRPRARRVAIKAEGAVIFCHRRLHARCRACARIS